LLHEVSPALVPLMRYVLKFLMARIILMYCSIQAGGHRLRNPGRRDIEEMAIRVSTAKGGISCFMLICVLADPVVLSLTWLHYQKRIVKKQVRRRIVDGLDRDELVLFKFSKSEAQRDLKWEHPGEFEYKKRMYDVVDTMIRGDSVYYWCLWDQKETSLNGRLENLIARALGTDSRISDDHDGLISHFESLYCPPLVNADLRAPGFFHSRFFIHGDPYCSVFIQPPTPPPRSM
jgi:hypothetical protein